MVNLIKMLHCVKLGYLLVLCLVSCQGKSAHHTQDLSPQDTLQFFTHAESDRIARAVPPVYELFVGSSIADIKSKVHYPIILPTKAGLEERYPESVWGYGDITPFGLVEITYDPTHHVVSSVYASLEWHPLAGSKVCLYDSDRVFEHDWLTSIDYRCGCCVLVFIRQMNLQDTATQVESHWIGASASIQSVRIGNTVGEFVSGHWAFGEGTDQTATTQTLYWTEDDEYGVLRWQVCDWLFEIRNKGQDAGFTFEDLTLLAQNIHNQVVC